MTDKAVEDKKQSVEHLYYPKHNLPVKRKNMTLKGHHRNLLHMEWKNLQDIQNCIIKQHSNNVFYVSK